MKWCSRRILLVMIVWLWMFIGFIVTSVLLAYIKGVKPTSEHIIELYSSEPYLAVYSEIASVGGLPLLISVLCKDGFAMYGFKRQGMLSSLGLSLVFAIVVLSLRIMQGGWFFESFNLELPLNIWYAVLGVLAYGPLEVFFIVWLIVNTDKLLNSRGKLLSPGLLITTTAFSLSHLVLSATSGVINAVSVWIDFIVLGLIFNYTGNAVGPAVAWTLINGQVPYLLVGCLT